MGLTVKGLEHPHRYVLEAAQTHVFLLMKKVFVSLVIMNLPCHCLPDNFLSQMSDKSSTFVVPWKIASQTVFKTKNIVLIFISVLVLIQYVGPTTDMYFLFMYLN